MNINNLISYLGVWIVATFVLNILTLFIVQDIRSTQVEKVNNLKVGDWMKIERKCIKCGAKQERDEKKSNENWEVYDNKVKCKCGGEYGLYIDDRLVGGD